MGKLRVEFCHFSKSVYLLFSNPEHLYIGIVVVQSFFFFLPIFGMLKYFFLYHFGYVIVVMEVIFLWIRGTKGDEFHS